jgi:hypothetical protein
MRKSESETLKFISLNVHLKNIISLSQRRIVIPKPLSEEQGLLNELKKQVRWWSVMRWVFPVAGILMLFRPLPLVLDNSFVGAMLIALTINRWHGDPKLKLLIKLCEEKLEREFIEEEVEGFRKKAAQEKKIEDFLEKLPQQPK